MNRKTIGRKYLLGLFLLPLILAGIFLLITDIQGKTRYNPAYFTEQYRSRYSNLSNLLGDLEEALITGDARQMAILQGTYAIPSKLKPKQNVRFSIFWSKEGKYLNYLYSDTKTYVRYMQHIREVSGRYVVIPESLYYYADSGLWLRVFLPLTFVWWIALGIYLSGTWIYRATEKLRQQMFGSHR